MTEIVGTQQCIALSLQYVVTEEMIAAFVAYHCSDRNAGGCLTGFHNVACYVSRYKLLLRQATENSLEAFTERS